MPRPRRGGPIRAAWVRGGARAKIPSGGIGPGAKFLLADIECTNTHPIVPLAESRSSGRRTVRSGTRRNVFSTAPMASNCTGRASTEWDGGRVLVVPRSTWKTARRWHHAQPKNRVSGVKQKPSPIETAWKALATGQAGERRRCRLGLVPSDPLAWKACEMGADGHGTRWTRLLTSHSPPAIHLPIDTARLRHQDLCPNRLASVRL